MHACNAYLQKKNPYNTYAISCKVFWQGPFYPRKIANSGWLNYYSQIFDYVEIDSSFYRIRVQVLIDCSLICILLGGSEQITKCSPFSIAGRALAYPQAGTRLQHLSHILSTTLRVS